ncbi:2Fe-2S iron-sulfur cluster-binding protein [Pelomonas sp. SE-A7]|uniref:2Fe-2S iron-sulfur cluster-binding protein n=1 Tax=Pelomonas sp. SE-A7 TaxID=3054953 RepID=UPI00259D1A91|nr:2Fe-2S iron-sulfur cluster-binding protein [Pelomonas sp. SE-A7]MDM4764564.1 2Fe-2S iron-sulfur cluster-binding protein [Pelomonas sp. SE-A7]
MPNKTEQSRDYEVRIVPQPQTWRCAGDQTLLLSALAAGLKMPHSCRNGSCRACMCRLLEGRIEYRIEWPGLLAEEKAAGWILPCVASPRSDLVLRRAGD